MVMSLGRKRLRRVLGILMVLSGIFFFSVAGLYASIRFHYVKVLDIAPALFKIDVLQYQTIAVFSDQKEQFRIADKMLHQGVFSQIYTDAGLVMLEDLALAGYAPAQMLQADLMMQYTPNKRNEALAYYKLAAAQGFIPARDKLETLAP